MSEGPEVNVAIVDALNGHRVRITFDDGNVLSSDQVFGTSEEARAAISKWVEEIGCSVKSPN
jgi:hypothetical protein